jgi:hypothetical protein
MPNHVHLLILPTVAVATLMRWLKGSTARRANQILGRTGRPFWQDESYDHYLRDPKQISRTTAYIEQNPVCAGLARSAEDWPWSSAGWQAKPPAPPPPQTTRTKCRNSRARLKSCPDTSCWHWGEWPLPRARTSAGGARGRRRRRRKSARPLGCAAGRLRVAAVPSPDRR